MKARISADRCAAYGCRRCAAGAACDIRALLWMEPDSPPIVQETACNGCGDCLAACPAGAIVLT